MTLALPGFADPVLDSQACFRAVLDAMARPGTIHTVAAPHDPPPPLDRATAAVLLTLVDIDTPTWLDPAVSAAADWIAFHCAPPPAALGHAAVVLAVSMPALAVLEAGTDDGPETGATVVLQCAALGTGPAYRLDGPGIEHAATLAISGLPADFPAQWAANRARFPCGIDLILCAGDRIAAFPRTLRIEAA